LNLSWEMRVSPSCFNENEQPGIIKKELFTFYNKQLSACIRVYLVKIYFTITRVFVV
jgi:hypothetical protein